MEEDPGSVSKGSKEGGTYRQMVDYEALCMYLYIQYECKFSVKIREDDKRAGNIEVKD